MRVLKGMLTVLVVLLLSTNAQASLEVIGTATYLGQDYNLIHMDDGPFGPITWLDYTRGLDTWQNQVNWASGLGGQLTVTLNPGYTSSVDWRTGWRLPSAGDNPHFGYNVTTSEMGYLYYETLRNKGYCDTSGNCPQPGWGLKNTCNFVKLYDRYYWSGTESPVQDDAWGFHFAYGSQSYDVTKDYYRPYALAVRPGDVSAVPVPGTVLLLGSGLAGLGAFRRGGRRRHWVIG